MKVLIASHSRYQVPLQILLKSLVDVAGWPLDDVVVVVAGSAAKSLEKTRDGLTIISTPRNAHELTAMAEMGRHWGAAGLRDDERMLLLHDTCVVGERFAACLQQAAAYMAANRLDAVWGCEERTFNILIGNKAFYDKVGKAFQGVDALSKYDAWRIEVKAHPCLSVDTIASDGLAVGAVAHGQRYMGTSRVYGGAERMKAYLPGLDVYKFFCLNNFQNDPNFKHPLRE